jgi:hypothetical protein
VKRYTVRGSYGEGPLAGALTITVDVRANDEDGAIAAAARSIFGDTLTRAKRISVIPHGDSLNAPPLGADDDGEKIDG